MGLPARVGRDKIADREVRIVGSSDLADRARDHHLADLDRRRVGRRIAHAAAHVRVEREPDGAQQNLAGTGLRHREFFQAKVLRLRLAHGARGQNNTAGDVSHGLNS